jgi:hypothetical protein
VAVAAMVELFLAVEVVHQILLVVLGKYWYTSNDRGNKQKL